MSPEIASNIISASSGLVGAIVGGIFTYIASKKGAQMQIDENNKKISDDNLAKEEIKKRLLVKCLNPEIELNYNVIGIKSSKDISVYLNGNISFKEYERVKFLLIEQGDEISEDIIDLYLLFQDYVLTPKNTSNQKHLEIINNIVLKKKKIDEHFQHLDPV